MSRFLAKMSTAPVSIPGVARAAARGESHPPRPGRVLNLGVTGHRPPRFLPGHFAPVCAALRQIVAELGALGGGNNPGRMRLVSPLAEGADRAAALAALELGLELQCPLPFHREEYERDFATEASRAEYRALLGRATAVLELDGRREDEAAAYLNAGRVMLQQSDVLVALWDGQGARGRGGTAEIVARAAALGIPVVQIAFAGGREEPSIRLVGEEDTGPWQEALRRRVGPLLGDEDARTKLYFSETGRRIHYGWPFLVFRNLVCLRKPWEGVRLRLPPFRERAAADLARWRAVSRLPEGVADAFEASFASHFAWADHLSIVYAGLYRSTYLLRYGFSALAVVFTVIASYSAFAWQGFLLQTLSVAAFIGLVLLENRKQWHLRALEYRIFAEHLRLNYFSYPLGLGVERISPFDGGLGTPPAWIARQLRAIVREAGMVSARITPEYLGAHRDFLRSANVEEQIAYHKALAHWQGLAGARLYRAAMFFFLLGLAAVVSRAVAYQWVPGGLAQAARADSPLWQERLLYWIKLCSVLFPAVGATLATVRSHGEFARLAARSAVLLTFLEARKKALAAQETADWESASRATRKIARELLGELIDWRTVIAGRGLSLLR